MDEEKRARPGDTAESPRKSPRLVRRAPAATEAESGVGLKALLEECKSNPREELNDPNAAPLDVIDVEKRARSGDTAATGLDVNDWWEKAGASQLVALVGNCRARRCRHVLCGEDEINVAITLIKTCDDTPMCNADKCDNTEGREISVCLDCESRFCTTHGKRHASINKHWVALVYKKPHVAYCFACEECYFIRTGNFGEVIDVDEDEYFTSFREEDEKGMIIDNEAGDHASGSVIGHACPIKGIPNLGNTCYLNSLVQCLLVLGRLRAGILGLDAPLGLLGSSLRYLFDDADSVNNAGGLLDPEKLLACVRMLNPGFKGNLMHDSQEALCYLRIGLDKEEREMKPSNMQAGAPSAVAPTVIDSIFGGQMSVTRSCRLCSFSSVSHDVFHDISVPLSQNSPAKSVESPPMTKGRRSPRKIHINLFPAINKHKSVNEKTHKISERGDSQSPASELEDVVLVKTSEPSKFDSTKVEQVSHSKDAIGGPLQTRKDKIQGKVVDVLPQKVLCDVKVEGMDAATADSRIPEDPASPSFVSPLREENAPIASGSDVEKNDSAVQPEVSTEAKMITSSAKVTTKNKGKAQISDVVYDKVHSIKSLASIEECLDLYLKTEEIEWTCENCSKVVEKPDIMSSTKEDTTAGDQSEQSEKSAYQVEENQNEQKDKNECPIQTRLFHKLPPVLTIHLMRYLKNFKKVIGHVSFKEILDVGQFMDPSSEDKDNSSYRLVGVVEHLGRGMNAGHYVAYVRPSPPQQTNGSASWFCASDTDITEKKFSSARLTFFSMRGLKAKDFNLSATHAMEEGKRTRVAAAADTAGSPWKSPRLEPPAAAAAEEDDSEWFQAMLLEASGTGVERCEHFMSDQDHVDYIVSGLRFSEDVPVCGDYTCDIAGANNIMVCLECELCLCVNHACIHAIHEEHSIALYHERLNRVYCFKCEEAYDIGVKDDDGGMTDNNEVPREESPAKSALRRMMGESLRQRSHVSGLADGHAHAIKGILNLGNTCYLNSLVQCLLVLGKLRARMLGPDTPPGTLGAVLYDLFDQTYGVNNAGGLLDMTWLLAYVRKLDSRFVGAFMQDNHELLCYLRKNLDEEDMRMNPPNMQDGAVTPTVIDSIFGGQLSSYISCKCCSFSSVSHVAFHDLSVPLPPKGPQSKGIASPTRTKGYKSQQKIHAKLFPEFDKRNTEKIHMIAEDSDSRSPSELEHVVLVKTSEPLKVDSTKVEQISHSKDAVRCPLQTQKDKVQGETVDFLPQNMLPDVKVEEMDLTKTDAHVPEDTGPPPLVSPLREENAWIESGSDVGKNVSAVLDDAFSEPEVSSEAKTDTFLVEATTEDKGKSRSSDIVCNKAQGINSLASIDDNPMMSSTNEDITVDGDQSKLSEKITCRSEQSNKRPECHEGVQEAVPSCIPAEKQANLLSNQDQNASILREERGKQVKLHHGAHQVEENQNEQKDRNKGGIKKHFISKLPPVLVIHLMRSLLGPHKVIGHVRFKEILDIGLFVDPSSEDKDNLSYRLVGVVEHRGLGNDAGHFLAYVRASPRQQTSGSPSWFRASDDNIREVSLEEVLKCEAYLLFYERMES
uniref:Ubiquitinyl hydrolase 1 n=1 Tax=Oryza punctata TaxID=4537 RepID=A0A0E0LX61_ORYPU